MAAPTTSIFNVSAIFGGKPWYKSLTAWGLIVYTVGAKFATEACGAGLLSDATCQLLVGWANTAGVVMTTLGLRRAAN